MRIDSIQQAQEIINSVLRARAAQGRRPGTAEFVAFLNDQEAGLLVFERFPSNSIGVVYEIYVLEQFRGKGVGQQLLDHSEALAREDGYLHLRLMPRSLDHEFISDQALASWYGKNGFKPDSDSSMWMQKIL